ncbi:zinc finger protein ZFPM1 isoform X2 [Pseudonaja textilis]|uniref:zinc finger protein ZFPM1 isoform X2 n=1 Tax=Pseudonaja textilis TaxID=8673 RepID=UPI000EA8BD7F|nr:zinc finger protein ZFPM1 isoform X2 [Pseudonaja textilis]
MSRRKQSKPRQIKRTLGEMEEETGGLLEDDGLSEKEGSASDHEGSMEGDSAGSPGSEKAESKEESLEESDKPQMPETETWTGPDELELLTSQAESKVCAKHSIPGGVFWGPFLGNIHSEPPSPGLTEPLNPPVTLILQDDTCWLAKLSLVPGEGDANSVIYKKDESIWCKTTRPLSEGDALKAYVMAEPMGFPNHAGKIEGGDATPPVALPSEIQLLPQQAGMAAILATAVVNKDVFPCKDCGIWYRSERNLQAHLMYYCASRQSATSPALDEKAKDAYPNERICPFPQCQKSCPSASSLEIHMRSHSGERPFVCLICLSAFTTKANCERHLKVHTDTLNGLSSPGSSSVLKCSFCGYVANCLTSLQQHVVLHSPAGTALPNSELKAVQPSPPATPAKSPLQDARVSPAEDAGNGSPPQDKSPAASWLEGAPPVQIKEEPLEEGEGPPGAPQEEAAPEPEAEVDASSRVPSPHSLPSVKVKSEITSPTPGSSPVPSELGASTSGGTVFLPQYMFGHEASVLPQASEILAKMSELVHSRLKQGHGGVPPALFPGTPLPKGATCFECEITFNNINNYYVHKRLYCSSRRLAEESPSVLRKAKMAPATAPKGPSAAGPHLSPGESSAAQEGEPEGNATLPALEIKQEVKVEEGGAKASPSPETDGTGRISEGSPSPGASSVEEPEDDPNRTVCEACNIRFSRHETYMVHKRYYCASRHDPPLRRSSVAGKLSFLPQPIRTRKRRKLYEIHGASSHLGAVPEAPRPEVPPVVPALISMVKASLSPSSSPDAEGPIDLSKKPRLSSGSRVLPASLLPLADYHECTACRISFHTLDSYLAHKKYYCPATPLQTSTLEQLQKIKGAAPTPLRAQGSPEGRAEEAEGVAIKVEKGEPSLSPVAAPGGFPAVEPFQQQQQQQRYLEGKAQHLAGAKVPLAVCPYCPINGAVKGDLVEHFRNTHGLFVTKTAAAGPTLIEATRTLADGSPLPSLPATSPLQPAPRLPKDSFNGKEAPVPPLSNGSPRPTASPQPLLPLSPSTPLPLSPLPEGLPSAPPPGYTDKGAQTPSGKGPPTPVANGSHRYCRLCNIKFSSLSTFIAHKKYYCSSHAAEHIK